jgi:hypothetical protein
MNSLRHHARFTSKAGFFLLAVFASSAARGDLITDAALIGPNPSIVTFETHSTALPSVPGLTFVDTTLQSSGPNFGGASSSNYYTTYFGSQHFGNLSTFRGYTSLAIDFADPQAAVGAYLQRASNSVNDPGKITTLVYGKNGALLESTTTTLPSATSGTTVFVGFSESAGISRIVWEPTTSGHIGVDNVTYSALVAVPEPASLLLLVLGGVVFAGRRLHGSLRRTSGTAE